MSDDECPCRCRTCSAKRAGRAPTRPIKPELLAALLEAAQVNP